MKKYVCNLSFLIRKTLRRSGIPAEDMSDFFLNLDLEVFEFLRPNFADSKLILQFYNKLVKKLTIERKVTENTKQTINVIGSSRKGPKQS